MALCEIAKRLITLPEWQFRKELEDYIIDKYQLSLTTRKDYVNTVVHMIYAPAMRKERYRPPDQESLERTY